MEILSLLCLLITLFLWATNIVSNLVASLFFFISMLVISQVPPEVVLSGFTSNAFWLVFSGSVIGFALKNSGLSDRLGGLIASHFGASYTKALFGFVLFSLLLSFAMPSTFGRIAILVPIAISFCDKVGLSGRSLGRFGIILATIVASAELSSSILPANLPNLVMWGVAKQNFNLNIVYSEYIMALFPAIGFIKGVILIGTSRKFFPEQFSYKHMGIAKKPFSKQEIYVSSLLFLTMLGWLTDSLHHLSASLIGLMFSFIYLTSIGRRGVSDFCSSIKLDTLWFIAAILGFAKVVQALGLPSLITHYISHFDLLGMGNIESYLFVIAIVILMTFLFTSNLAPAIFSPLAKIFSTSGLGVKTILFSQVVGYSTIFFPYQAPPIVFGAALSNIPNNVAIKYCILTAIFSLLIVAPFNFIWWKAIHLIG